MKRLIAVCAGIGAIGVAAAIAGHHEDWEAKVEEHFAKVDSDASGSISEAEYVAYVTEKARAEFAEAAGDDGTISLDEAKAHHQAKMEKHKAKMEEHKPAEGEHGKH